MSVVIPCRNEAAAISACLDSLLANELGPLSAELLVVDGASTDGTRAILDGYAARYPTVRILRNEQRFTPHAMNIGIRAARGRYIVIAGAHAIYARNYLRTLVDGVVEFGAQNVGGLLRAVTVRDNVIAWAISLAVSEPFAAGNAYYRLQAGEPREVASVFGGCYPREVFDRIGLFNERLRRTQDRELNIRLRRAGGKIVLDPRTACEYRARVRLGEYTKWVLNGAYALFSYHRYTEEMMLGLRNLVPPGLVAAIVAAVLLRGSGPILGPLAAAPVVVYGAASVARAAAVARREGSLRLWPAMTLVFWTTHLAYGLGALAGLPWFAASRLRLFWRRWLAGNG